ncbi:glycoside hydrolase family 2 TIM barrel-domain containing protein [Novipirellula herctigrandis]
MRNNTVVIAVVLLATCCIANANASASANEFDGVRTSFNSDWKFSREARGGAEAPQFDDRSWQPVTLPHDWAIAGPFEPKYNARNGGLPFHGTGWYRKRFSLPTDAKGKAISVAFDGAMYNAHVYINGKFLGNRPFGYVGFQFDLSEHLKFGEGESNVIAVKMSPEDLSTRWYPGAGIYRNTWLEINDPIHVGQWGTYVTTPEITDSYAKVAVRTTIENSSDNASNPTIVTSVLDEKGKVVAETSGELAVDGRSIADLNQHLKVSNPIRWDVENPYRYQVRTEVLLSGKVVDTYTTPLGIRTIEYSANKGFLLNGIHVPIQGVCLHHDNGPLGAISNRRAIERKLQIMKSMGVNSVRTSHNPPSPELVESADQLGILLQVEAFDVWKIHKQMVAKSYNLYFDEWHERDVRDMIRQHRNNPSVIMWSIGNEIMEQGAKDGGKVARKLTEIAHDEDPSRLVAAGFNNPVGAIKNGLADEVDIIGLNYKPLMYESVHKEHPDWLLLASETSSVTSTRGVYHFPIEKYKTHDSRHVTSYDLIGPPWAYPPDVEFEYLSRNPFVMGEYVWTGFDYLGEPTPYGGKDHSGDGYWNADWPVRSSSFGAVDLSGFPKDRYYLYQSQWTKEPMVHVLPHWNWENKAGETIPVYAYTNAEEVELFVNGKSMGKKKKGIDKADIHVDFLRWDTEGEKDKVWKSPFRLGWDVEYEPGSIKVVAYTDGEVVAEKEIKTAGPPAKIHLVPDRKEIQADGQDLSYVSVLIEDKDGNLCPNAENLVRFFVDGAGEIAAVGNGNSSTVELFNVDYRRAFYGKAMLIVRSKAGEKGEIHIRAYSDRLAEAKLKIESH